MFMCAKRLCIVFCVLSLKTDSSNLMYLRNWLPLFVCGIVILGILSTTTVAQEFRPKVEEKNSDQWGKVSRLSVRDAARVSLGQVNLPPESIPPESKSEASSKIRLLKDLNSGSEGSDPREFIVYNGAMYFQANDGEKGEELWRYDGSSVNLIKDINPGPQGSSPNDFAVYKDRLYFQAIPDYRQKGGAKIGSELYKYNGSKVSLVKDINPGKKDEYSAYGSFPSNLTTYKGKLYFNASDGNKGEELWSYDGTTVRLVRDINPGEEGSKPSNLTVYEGKLFFEADKGETGSELWSYDGSSVTLVKDIVAGKKDSSPSELTVYDGKLYFTVSPPPSPMVEDFEGRGELWSYDGSDVNLVEDINPEGASDPFDLTVYQGELYFTAEDGEHGREVWTYNGSSARLVKDISPGEGDGNPLGPHFSIYGESLYFTAGVNANLVETG